MSQTILLVEDEAANRRAVKRVLNNGQVKFVEAEDGQQALDILSETPVDLILLDLGMPVMDGYSFLTQFKENKKYNTIPVCVMTAWSDAANRRKAVDIGADDFIGKPVDNTELETRTKSLLRISKYQKQLREMNAGLEAKVQERTMHLQAALDELESAWQENTLAYREMVMRLALAAEFKDEDTASHLHRISHYSILLARKCGWPDDGISMLFDAVKLHDIGKIGIPDAVLKKNGKLTAEEYTVMKKHPEIGASMLSGSESGLLKMAREIALSHHERFDGSGYPNALAGKDIPETGRIAAIADVFDALTTRRVYKEPWPFDRVKKTMFNDAGTHFDPELLTLFFEDDQDLLGILRKYPDE